MSLSRDVICLLSFELGYLKLYVRILQALKICIENTYTLERGGCKLSKATTQLLISFLKQALLITEEFLPCGMLLFILLLPNILWFVTVVIEEYNSIS